MSPISIERTAVVREALEWCGTPFHDRASLKGEGCDCAGLLKGVFTAPAIAMVDDFQVPNYSPQWFQHRDEELFLKALEEHGGRRIDLATALPGDVLMYNFGRHAAHGAIIVSDTAIVHAYKPARKVTKGERRELLHRFHSAWTLFP